MKHIFFIIIVLLYCESAFSQQETNEVMKLSLPNKTQKLNTSQINSLNSKRIGFGNLKDFDNHIYQKDSLLIYYKYLHYPPDMPGLPSDIQNLKDIEKEVRAYRRANTIDTSKIIMVNNIYFLIIEYHENDVYYLRFTSDHDKKLRYINGFIEFKKSDEEKAWAYLNELLHSMHFKEK